MMRTQAEVWLIVTGEQTNADGRKDVNRTKSRAVYENRAGIHVFTFAERDPQSGAVTESVMEISEGACTIVRRGEIRTRMSFVPDEERHCQYDTPFGSISMAISTSRIAMREIGENFHARIGYTMTLQGTDPMECAVTIKAEPVS